MGQRRLAFDEPTGPLAAAWDRWRPPERYAAPWQALRGAALADGLAPEALDGETLEASGLGILARHRDWQPATIALYAKVATYAGLAVPRLTTPEPVPWPVDLALLWADFDEGHLEQVRAAAWCRIAIGWPAPLARWSGLSVDEVHILGADVEADGVRVPGAAGLWAHWMDLRRNSRMLSASPWALPTLRPGPHRPGVGRACTPRALQAAFVRHAVRVSGAVAERGFADADWWARLNYDTFRRLTLAAGTGHGIDRGRVRAARRPG